MQYDKTKHRDVKSAICFQMFAYLCIGKLKMVSPYLYY